MAMEIDADDSGGNGLVGDKPFGEKLIACHRKIHGGLGYGSLGRMAVATYDRDSDALSVHADSDLRGQPFRLWSAPLSSVPSLYALAPSGQVRVVRGVFAEGSTGEPQTIAIRQNHRSSRTVPVRRDDRFYGFIFFNSDQPDFFTYEVVERVLPHGQLLAAIVVADADRIDTLVAAVRTTRDIGNLRDDETAGHLQRMTAYTRMIATDLAPRHDISERWIGMITHFAPLHDVGKIGIPDSILFKPGKLDDAERLSDRPVPA